METFKENGSYNKTDWKIGDIITSERLNKIEDALYEINENSNDVNKLDLSNYVTKAEMPTNVSAFNNDMEYVTRSHTHNNYVTKTYVDDAIANIETGDIDLSNYATKTYVDNAISNIEPEDIDLSSYALKSEIPTNLSAFNNDVGYMIVNGIIRIEVVTEYPAYETPGVLYIKVSE